MRTLRYIASVALLPKFRDQRKLIDNYPFKLVLKESVRSSISTITRNKNNMYLFEVKATLTHMRCGQKVLEISP